MLVGSTTLPSTSHILKVVTSGGSGGVYSNSMEVMQG